jgi:hypothetical protein
MQAEHSDKEILPNEYKLQSAALTSQNTAQFSHIIL